jgi:hypothetical protein
MTMVVLLVPLDVVGLDVVGEVAEDNAFYCLLLVVSTGAKK